MKPSVENQPTIAEIQLSYKPSLRLSQQPVIKTSEDAYRLFLNSWDMEKIDFVEQFKVLLLTRSNSVLGILNVSSGGVTSTVVDPRIIFSAAIKANACAIILGHNHPSGNLKPSQPDLDLTQKIKQGARFFDISVLDHVIVTREEYFSFADEGVL
ncbi:MAG: JAB domain-containing protein [Chitinophagaceae bacterium]|nr:JAB domain-containing protein [Chitinophagaceae bacterium]